MSTYDPLSLLFGGMEKLGPGDNADTLYVLRLLPRRPFRFVVDAGCGTGRQTLALAKALGIPVHAVDAYEPFLSELRWRARDAKLGELVQTGLCTRTRLAQRARIQSASIHASFVTFSPPKGAKARRRH